VGFGRKTPKPNPNVPVTLTSPTHTHTYWQNGKRTQVNCQCATGQSHTTPELDPNKD
jgi:hypothetical protein